MQTRKFQKSCTNNLKALIQEGANQQYKQIMEWESSCSILSQVAVSLWVLISLSIFGRNTSDSSASQRYIFGTNVSNHDSCCTLFSSIKTNRDILKFSRATVLQSASASSATLSIASKLILENIDLSSTLNFTPQNYFEVRSLFFFNRKLSNSTRKQNNAIQDLRQRCCPGSVRCRRARQGSQRYLFHRQQTSIQRGRPTRNYLQWRGRDGDCLVK